MTTETDYTDADVARLTMWLAEYPVATPRQRAYLLLDQGVTLPPPPPDPDPVDKFAAECWAHQANGTQGGMHDWIRRQVEKGRIVIPAVPVPPPDPAVVVAKALWPFPWDPTAVFTAAVRDLFPADALEAAAAKVQEAHPRTGFDVLDAVEAELEADHAE